MTPSQSNESAILPQLPRKMRAGETIFNRSPLKKQDFHRMVRQIGLKVTQQRIFILQSLHEGRQHMTAQEIFEDVKNLYPKIGFATVYRFLKKLIENSLATELRMGGFSTRYELCSGRHHDHITCTVCGAIVEFENEVIEKTQIKVAKDLGFSLGSHVLELYGECQHCRKTDFTENITN